MGAVMETLIFCDGPNCPRDGPYGDGDTRSLTARQQRQSYRLDGWTYRGGKDYCPECRDKIHEAPSRGRVPSYVPRAALRPAGGRPGARGRKGR